MDGCGKGFHSNLWLVSTNNRLHFSDKSDKWDTQGENEGGRNMEHSWILLIAMIGHMGIL